MGELIVQIIAAMMAAIGILVFAIFLFLRVADKLITRFKIKP